jgi:NAD(P)-dependent dehydrogenase (short-subunit alcohol dehydrogenase family)
MKNKVALITGGTSGIGEITARLLAERGAKIAISGRRQELGQKIVDSIKSKGGEAVFFRSNVDTEAEVETLIRGIVEQFGRLDMAVNNAGISNETMTIGDSDTEKYKAMLQTNVLGVYLCMKHEIKQMLKNGGGAIVNLASIAGLNGIPWAGPYSSTKHAVVGLTKSGALDYATQNIRINAVAPGAIKTDIIAGSITQGTYDEKMINAMHPMQRMGKPEEIGYGIRWLLSDEASFVTGHVLNIDGGFQAK